MPDYAYAILSALLWALSAPVINYGLEILPDYERTRWIALGLVVAMMAGVLALTPFLWVFGTPITINSSLIFSGLLTFPLATGSYYIAGAAFSRRTEFASQFSKVKPLITFILAVMILHESITTVSIVSVSTIAVGTCVFLWGVRRHLLSGMGVAFGLLAALFWALGELFMKIGIQHNQPILANWVAMISGLLVFGIAALPNVRHIVSEKSNLSKLWPFFLHGLISFGAAYSLFFYSILHIGLAKTVLINAFWPILSVLITALIRVARRQPVLVPKVLIFASLILLCGSLIQVLGEF